jgi:hypothetical protein
MTRRVILIFGVLALGLAVLTRAAVEPSATELASLAARAISTGNNNLAIYYYQEALKRQPGRIDWRVWVAEALQKRGNDELALEEARKVIDKQPGNARAQAVIAELTKPVIIKSKEQEQKEEEEQAVTSVPFPEKSTEILPQALGAWIEGDTLQAAEVVNKHNLSVSKAQQIYYFFVPAGELVVEGKKLLLTFDPAQALSLFSAVNTDSRIIPVIRGSSTNINKVLPSEFTRVAAEVAAKVDAENRLSGVMFDFAYHDIRLHQLYASFKKATKKPLFAVGGDRLTFKYIDVGVLKCFGFGINYDPSAPQTINQRTRTLANGKKVNNMAIPDIKVFNGNVDSNAGQYLKNARANGGKALIGLPFIATSSEFESWSEASGGAQNPSGVRMNDYISNAIAWTEKSVQVRDEAFLGLAIWAIHPDGGVQMKPDPNWYYPSLISQDWWERMKKPLINR